MALEANMIHLGRKVDIISELDDIDELVRVYRPRVRRYVVYSIKDQDLADTITQDCFFKAYAGRESFRGDCAVSTWLMSIANNLTEGEHADAARNPPANGSSPDHKAGKPQITLTRC